MADFVSDTFTDADATNLTAHTGETGATWTAHPNGGAAVITGNQVKGNAGGNNLFYASGTPASADYTVALDVINPAAGNHKGPMVRMDTAIAGWYSITVDGTSVYVYKSAATLIAVAGATLSGSQTYRVYASVSGSATTTVSVKIKRLSDGFWLTSSNTWQAGEVACMAPTDSSSPVTAAGKAGMWLSQNEFIDNFTAGVPSVGQDILVTDANMFFSPYNWKKSGSTYAQTNNAGAYFKTKFTGTSCTLNVDVSPIGGTSAGDFPVIEWKVDAGSWQRVQLTSTTTTISLATGLSAGTHSLEVHCVGTGYAEDLWIAPVMVLRVTGLTIDAGATTAAPTLRTKRMFVVGDSHLAGLELLGTPANLANSNARLAYGALIAGSLDAEYGSVGFSSQGYTQGGTGSVPALTSAWDLYWSGNSRLVSAKLSPIPDYVFSGHGHNDSGGSSGTVSTAVATFISGIRAAVNSTTPIFICSPPNHGAMVGISGGVTAAADSFAMLVDTGVNYLSNPTYTSGGHLSQAGHVAYSNDILAGLDATPPTTPNALVPVIDVAKLTITLNLAGSTDANSFSYNVYKNGSSTPTATGQPGPTWSEEVVAGGADISYQVEAQDAVGNKSAKTASVTVSLVVPTAAAFATSAWTYPNRTLQP